MALTGRILTALLISWLRRSSELKQAETEEQKAQEFGDLLFTLVNVARRLGVDSEAALREANRKFYQRFTYMEEVCRQRGAKYRRPVL